MEELQRSGTSRGYCWLELSFSFFFSFQKKYYITLCARGTAVNFHVSNRSRDVGYLNNNGNRNKKKKKICEIIKGDERGRKKVSEQRRPVYSPWRSRGPRPNVLIELDRTRRVNRPSRVVNDSLTQDGRFPTIVLLLENTLRPASFYRQIRTGRQPGSTRRSRP